MGPIRGVGGPRREDMEKEPFKGARGFFSALAFRFALVLFWYAVRERGAIVLSRSHGIFRP